MTKLFILFQGIGMMPDEWNTDGKFLQSLKKNGKVYMYENKIYNTAHYDNKNPGRNNYGKDIDFDIDYFDIKKHLKLIYDSISQYKDLDWIPIGFSLGGHLAVAFANLYKSKCSACILLDTSMRMNIEFAKKRTDSLKIKETTTNNELQKILNNIKTNKENQKDIKYIHDLWIYKCTKYTSDHSAGKNLPVPTYAFMNIFIDDWNVPEVKLSRNKELYKDIAYLEKDKNYHYILFVNVGHLVFRNKKESDIIINTIKNI